MRKLRFLPVFYILFFWMFVIEVSGQNEIGKIINLSVENKPLVQVLYELSEEHHFKFFFDPADLPYYPLNDQFEEKPVYTILQKLTDGTKLIVLPHEDKGLCLIDKTKANVAYIESLIADWENGSIVYPFDESLKILNYTFGNKLTDKLNASLEISLWDESSKDPIVGAVISNEDLSINGVSDPLGKIILDLPIGIHSLTVNYIGYQSTVLNVQLYDNGSIEIPMNFQTFLFEEVEVVASSLEQKLKDANVGKEVINIKKIEAIPQVLGEVDIIKSLEVLPGVTSAGELSAGFNVRGGSIDESLVLLNDGIIFNPTHIVGFISAFNADVLDNATLYKAYVDPAYGGRGSAVLDLKADASNAKKWNGKGGLGTSMIKLFLEGPVTKKLKFHISGRGSFNDYLLKLIANVELQRSNASFYDLNGGLMYEFNENHKILFNSYVSNDLFEYNDEFGFRWSNKHFGLQWKSNWNEKFYSSLSLNYGTYDSDNFTRNNPDAASFKTGLYYYKLIASLNREIGKTGFLKLGTEYIDFYNRPDRIEPDEISTLVANSIQRKSGASLSPFLTFNQKIGKQITFEAGVRYSNYYSKGPGKLFQYSTELKQENTITEESTLSGRDPEGSHQVVEPRMSINYNLKDNWSVKAAYNKMSQNMLQLSTTNTTLPSDIWIFTDRYTKPLIVNQYSIGVFTADKKKNYSLALDLFSKSFSQLFELQDFSQIILNEHLETELIEAKGRSYGLELLMQKQKGKWKGSLAYTFSRSLRKTIDANKSINKGTEFPANFDIPHQLNVLASFQGLPVLSFNFAYVFKSGIPTTAPSATIIQDGFVVPLYSFKNQERIPYYARLDFSMTMDLRKAKQKGFRSSFTLGFYNLLGRNNANSVFFRRSAKGNIIPFQFAVVGSTIPNLSWNFVF